MFIVREKGLINYELRMTEYELESVNDPRRTLGLNGFESLRDASFILDSALWRE